MIIILLYVFRQLAQTGIIACSLYYNIFFSFMQVIWHRLVKQSPTDKGTLWQLRNLLNRSGFTLDPSVNVKCAEDFLSIVLDAYIVAAGETIMATCQVAKVEDLAKAVVDSFISLDLFTGPSQLPSTDTTDGVQAYAKEVLTLGLVWLAFHDAVKEGDGERVILYWKFLLLLFKADGRHNYSREAVNLLVSHQYLLSPRQSAELQWSRFVNTQGRQGCNVPVDLHMEHLNRRLKFALKDLHSNVTPKAINRIGRSLGVVSHICDTLEQTLHLTASSDSHTPPSTLKDFQLVLKCLQEEEVFQHKASRQYGAFTFKQGLFQEMNMDHVVEWLRNLYAKLH